MTDSIWLNFGKGYYVKANRLVSIKKIIRNRACS